MSFLVNFWLGLGNPRHIATISQHLWAFPRQIRFWSILKKSWDWVRPPPSLGQNPNFYQKFVLHASLTCSTRNLFCLLNFVDLSCEECSGEGFCWAGGCPQARSRDKAGRLASLRHIHLPFSSTQKNPICWFLAFHTFYGATPFHRKDWS